MNDDLDVLPSGVDYGRIIRYGWIDDRDFTLACCVKDGVYTWVIEHESGDVVFTKVKHPDYEPIFGIDEGEWMFFVNTEGFQAVDAYIESKGEKDV